MQNDVRPTKDQRVDHVGRSSHVESKERARKRQVPNKKHCAYDDLQQASKDCHWDALACRIHVPSCEHVGYDADGLDSDWVGVDLSLREGVFVVFEPEEEGVLEGEGFDCCANWGPEEEDPAVCVRSACLIA